MKGDVMVVAGDLRRHVQRAWPGRDDWWVRV